VKAVFDLTAERWLRQALPQLYRNPRRRWGIARLRDRNKKCSDRQLGEATAQQDIVIATPLIDSELVD